MTRDHSIAKTVVDARALLMAAAARLEDSNFHNLAQIITAAEAELVSASGVVIDGQAPELLNAIQQLADLAYALDDDTLAAAGFASLREAASTLRSHVEDLETVLALSRYKASPVGGKGPAAKDCVGELRPAALWCEPERLGTAARLLAELGDCNIQVRSDDGLEPDPGGRVIVMGAIARLTPNLLERLREHEKEVDALCALAGSGVFSRRSPRPSRLDDNIPY